VLGYHLEIYIPKHKGRMDHITKQKVAKILSDMESYEYNIPHYWSMVNMEDMKHEKSEN
jgi:hypothetical protein